MDTSALLFLAGVAALSFALSFYGAAVGLILGHLRLPLMVYYLPSTVAGMATNLAISGAGAFTGAMRHARAGRVSWPLVALMGVPSLAGALLGGLLLVRVEPSLTRLFIGGFLLWTGCTLFRPRSHQETSPINLRCGRLVLETVLGLALGVLSSLTGLMLGSLRLPVMIRLLRVDAEVAVGTNMVIGCLTALVGAISLWPLSEPVPWLPLLIVVPPTVLGGYLGARFTGRMSKELLHKLIGTTIVLTGLGMAGEAAWRLIASA